MIFLLSDWLFSLCVGQNFMMSVHTAVDRKTSLLERKQVLTRTFK